ncbi:hypothetical protein [Streptomyces sp. NPDC018352]|uniref:hypothetical protein n=1 Tax=Streptomyces sp. NPDC018352 TaxID=3157194 RepID=UPI0033D0E050
MSDREQLLHLVDRARRGVLLPAELDALAAGIHALADSAVQAEQMTEAITTAAAHLTTLVGKRSEKAEKDATAQRQRAKIAEAELHVLRSGLRANGADPTQIQNLWAQIRMRNKQWREAKKRAERAEAATARVRALATRWAVLRSYGGAAYELRNALDEKPDETTPFVHQRPEPQLSDSTGMGGPALDEQQPTTTTSPKSGCPHCGAIAAHLPSRYMKNGVVGYCHGELTPEQQPTEKP